MERGGIAGTYDVALLALQVFTLFFFILICYLRREDRREGYPLESNMSNNPGWKSFAFLPAVKTFLLPHGGTATAPHLEKQMPIAADTSGVFRGLPIEPTGNPMIDGVGPAAYAQRSDEPEAGFEDNKPRIMPLRLLPDFTVESADPDPRGMPVIAGDGVIAGHVRDVWIDRAEVMIRYIEVDVAATERAPAKRVLVPMPLVQIRRKAREAIVRCVFAHHFADAPVPKSLEQITLLEEDRISAYFASGQLYASPERMGPLI
jgi:photosynthetic reaction center H subunit